MGRARASKEAAREIAGVDKRDAGIFPGGMRDGGRADERLNRDLQR